MEIYSFDSVLKSLMMHLQLWELSLRNKKLKAYEVSIMCREKIKGETLRTLPG